MISVLIIWIYILVVITAAGCCMCVALKKLIGYSPADPIAVLLTGLVTVTVYAGTASLFGGVGLTANIFMCIVLLLSCLLMRRQVFSLIKNITSPLLWSHTAIAAGVGLLVFMAYGTSHGIMHYDTSLYHAQAIHWIEEYGVVPGLANLHTRLGYNSSAFPLTALFSMSFTGQSYHVTAGLCALLLAWECIVRPLYTRRTFYTAAGAARIMGIYYLLMVFDEIVSPASDYFIVTLVFLLIIRWADAESEPEDVRLAHNCVLSVYAVFLAGIKLSGGILILIALLPAVILIRSKKIIQTVSCIALGFISILPYLIRNVILSGRILYPSCALDIFPVDWKVPYDIAQYDRREIQVFARGHIDVSRYGESISVWFPEWFASQSATDRVLIAAAIVGVLFFVVKCIYYGFMYARQQKPVPSAYSLYTEGVIAVGFVFWLVSAPLMRYGCMYVYLTDALIWGGLILRAAADRRELHMAVALVLIALLAYKSAMFCYEVIASYRGDTWIRQQDYDTCEVTEYQLTDADGGVSVDIYMPVEGDRTGYDAFPSSTYDMSGTIRLRGDDLRDGFAPR